MTAAASSVAVTANEAVWTAGSVIGEEVGLVSSTEMTPGASIPPRAEIKVDCRTLPLPASVSHDVTTLTRL
jgi:hypothetical protein